MVAQDVDVVKVTRSKKIKMPLLRDIENFFLEATQGTAGIFLGKYYFCYETSNFQSNFLKKYPVPRNTR